MDSTVPVEIIDYEERYKQDLEDISLPWLLEYDLLEPVDLEMLADPHRFVADGGRVLLARQGQEIVGMVMLELQGDGICEALKFGVKEEYREQGIGTALMEAVIQAARDAGLNTSRILTNGFNFPISEWNWNYKKKDALCSASFFNRQIHRPLRR